MPLKYKKVNVEAALADFMKNNPEATQIEITAKRDSLIIIESVREIVLDHYSRFGDKYQNVDERLENVKSGEDLMFKKVLAYFDSKKLSDVEHHLEQFQDLALNDKEGKVIPNFANLVSIHIRNIEADDHTFKMTQEGDAYIKGMFAPETDSSGMKFDINYTDVLSKKLFEEKQKEADSIKIKVPEGMTEDLVSFAVMGEFMKGEHFEELGKLLYSGGSTLLDDYSVAENAQMSFFENAIVGDSRANMHANRLVVPEVRTAAKEIIESGDMEKIGGLIKNCFDAFYSRAATTSDLNKSVYLFSVRNAGKLIDQAQKCGFDLEKLGIDEKKINHVKAMNKFVEFNLKTQDMLQEHRNKFADIYFNGMPEKDDLINNPEAVKELNLIMARKNVADHLKDELVKFHSAYDILGVDNDKAMESRDLSEIEKRFLNNDEEGLINEHLNFVNADENKKIWENQLKTPESRMIVMSDGFTFDKIPNVPFPIETFLRDVQDSYLDNIEEFASQGDDRKEVLESVKNIKELVSTMEKPYTLEQMNQLVAPYEELGKKVNDLCDKMMEDPKNLLDKSFTAFHVLNVVPGNVANGIKQKDFENRRKTLHENVANDRIKYDHEKAAAAIKEFILANPKATIEEVREAEIDIVVNEAMIYSKLSAFEKCAPSCNKFDNFEKKEQELRDKNCPEMRVAREAAKLFSGDEKLKFIEAFQKNFNNATTEEQIKELNACVFHLKECKVGSKMDKVLHSGDGVFKALFAAKTDATQGIRMSDFDNKGLIKSDDILRWQKETDELVITPPVNMSEDLVPFLVLGRTIQSDLLLQASELTFGPGSTLPLDFKEGNSRVSLWDNLVDNDMRGNMHCMRSVVPTARRDVINLIADGNDAKLNELLKNSFDAMYDQIMGTNDHDKHIWLCPMKQINVMLDALKKNGISTESLGIDQKKVETINQLKPIHNFMIEKAAVEDELFKNDIQFFMSGFDPKYDPTKNEDVKRLCESWMVKGFAAKCIADDCDKLTSEFSGLPLSQVEDISHKRDLTENEIIAFKDAKVFEEMVSRLFKNEIEEAINEMTDTNAHKMNFMRLGFVRFSGNIKFNQVHCETYAVDYFLDNLKETLESPEFADANGIDSLKTHLDDLIEFRKGFGGNFNSENIKELVEPYGKMFREINQFVNNLKEDVRDLDCTTKLLALGGKFEDFQMRISREPERIEAVNDRDEVLNDIKNGLKPAFSANFDKYKDVLQKMGPGSDNVNEFNTMMASMTDFNNKINALCGNENNRDTIMSPNDIKALTTSFNKALTDCSNFLSASGKNPMSDGRTFIVTELQSLMSRDMKFFDGLDKTNSITLSGALADRYAGGVDVETSQDRFKALSDKLAEVGSRFGGNSKEFDKMKDALDGLKKDNLTKKELVELSAKLSKAVEKYIDAKETVPSTEKGKMRLQIARETRELCREIKEANAHEPFAAKRGDKSTYIEKIGDYIKVHEDVTIIGVNQAARDIELGKLSQKVSELVYFKAVQEKLSTEGKKTVEYLKESAMKQGVDKIKLNVDELLKGPTGKDLSEALGSKEPEKEILKVFKAHMTEITKDKNVKAPDLADKEKDKVKEEDILILKQ